MINRNNIYRWLFVLALMPITLTACLEDEVYGECPSKAEQIQLTLTLPEQTRIATNTRATSERVDYSIVNNLNLVLVEGTSIKKIYYFNENSITPNEGNIIMTRNTLPMEPEKGDNKRSITIKGEEGEFNKVTEIYAIANYNRAITVKTVNDLKNLQQSAADGQPGKANDCMMFGSTKQLYNGKISLERTLAMFSVKMDGSGLSDGVRITPKRISLHNVPTSCFIGKENKIKSDNVSSVAIGQVVDLTSVDGWGALTKEKGTVGGHELEEGTIPMFMFENLQGINQSIKSDQQVTKHPKDHEYTTPIALQAFLDNGQKYTYLLVEADYYYQDPRQSNKEIKGSIAYRFLLGDNEYNDFNVRRNNYYQITLNLIGYGGANEDGKEVNGNLVVNDADVSWRVEMNIRDWGFVKDKFDFDCHTEIGKMDIIGSGWKIAKAVNEKGQSIAGQSWIKFNTSQAGTTDWSEPTSILNIGVGEEIYYYIEPIQEHEFLDENLPTKRVAILTLERTINGKTETQTVTITQWYPIKISTTIDSKKCDIFMERFEEESKLPWGCNNVDLNSPAYIHVPSTMNPNKNYNFGDLTSTYLAGNSFFVWSKEGHGSSFDYKRDLGMAASAYCLNKSFTAPKGGTGSSLHYYTLPSAKILQELIKYSESHSDGTFEPLHISDDYWTSTVMNSTSQEISYWEGNSQTVRTTNKRDNLKRVRAIYMQFGQDDSELFD